MKRRQLLIGSAGLPLIPFTLANANTPCPPQVIGAATQTCEPPAILPLGALSQDAVTPEQIALYLPVVGAISQSATASVEFKPAGAANYNQASPLWRIQPQYSSVTVEDAFAGTIFDLVPGNSYDVQVTVTDPGVGTQVLSATYNTRALPAAAGPATVTVSDEASLLAAISAATPGNVIEFSGTIDLSERFEITASGTETNPIYLRGTNRDTSIMTAPSSAIRGNAADWWIFENFTLRGSQLDTGNPTSKGFTQAEPSTGWTIRNMRVEGFDIASESFKAQDSYLIYDSIFDGNNAWTQANVESNLTWDDDGIRLGGIGSCIWNCSFKGFGDSISYRNQNSSSHDVIGCYFYRNKTTDNGDDAVEAEYCRRNCAIYDSYFINSGGTILSVDGVFGGPLYFFRNRGINCGREIIKNGAAATGVLIYNNTFVKTQGKAGGPGSSGRYMWYFPTPLLNAWEFKNNLLLWEGTQDSILRFDGSDSRYTPRTWTHNGWGRNGQSITYAGNGLPVGDVATVNAELSPVHDNDIEITSQAAVLNTPVVFGPDYLTELTTEYDLTIRAGAENIGRGVLLPNISRSNDIGALGFGETPPAVGNRFTG